MILPKIQPFDCTIGVNGSPVLMHSSVGCSDQLIFAVWTFYNPFGLWRTFWVQKLIVCFLWFYEVFLFNAYESFIEYSSLLLFVHSFTVVVSHRTCMEKLYSLGFTQTLPEWRYLPLQKQSVGRFSFSHTHTFRPAWKGWALSWGSVPRLSTVWKGSRVQRWVRILS